jgi:hypothetical protein
MILVDFIMRQIILIIKLLPLFKLMAQSRRGVFQVLEAQMRPLTKAIPRFIQMNLPLLPLKPMVRSRHGVDHILEAQIVLVKQLNSNIATLFTWCV